VVASTGYAAFVALVLPGETAGFIYATNRPTYRPARRQECIGRFEAQVNFQPQPDSIS